MVDEVLAVLKNESTRESDKKQEVSALVGSISNEFFADLLLNAR